MDHQPVHMNVDRLLSLAQYHSAHTLRITESDFPSIDREELVEILHAYNVGDYYQMDSSSLSGRTTTCCATGTCASPHPPTPWPR
jgi:ferredoxin-like protein FixX